MPGYFITVLLPIEQDPDLTVARLAPLAPVLYKALEVGTIEAHGYFADRKQRVDSYLFPCLVRYHAKMILDDAGHRTQEFEFDRRNLANNGLELWFGDYRVRILKARNGLLPSPGTSRTKQQFYHQLPLMDQSIESMNLLVLWDHTPTGLAQLTVCRPARPFRYDETPEYLWIRPLRNPAFKSPAAETHVADEDLDIRLKERKREQA